MPSIMPPSASALGGDSPPSTNREIQEIRAPKSERRTIRKSKMNFFATKNDFLFSFPNPPTPPTVFYFFTRIMSTTNRLLILATGSSIKKCAPTVLRYDGPTFRTLHRQSLAIHGLIAADTSIAFCDQRMRVAYHDEGVE